MLYYRTRCKYDLSAVIHKITNIDYRVRSKKPIGAKHFVPFKTAVLWRREVHSLTFHTFSRTRSRKVAVENKFDM